MCAAQEGHAEVATFLLDKGAFVDFPDEVWATFSPFYRYRTEEVGHEAKKLIMT